MNYELPTFSKPFFLSLLKYFLYKVSKKFPKKRNEEVCQSKKKLSNCMCINWEKHPLCSSLSDTSSSSITTSLIISITKSFLLFLKIRPQKTRGSLFKNTLYKISNQFIDSTNQSNLPRFSKNPFSSLTLFSRKVVTFSTKSSLFHSSLLSLSQTQWKSIGPL